MESGTTVAAVPMLVPMIILENGKSKIINIINGNERNTFTTRSIS